MFEILNSFTPNRKNRTFTVLFNIEKELLAKEIAKDNPLADELRNQIQKSLSKERLLRADTLDGFWTQFSEFTEAIEIFPELEIGALESLADHADQYGWDIRYYQEYLPRKQSGSLVMQSQTNPMGFITYCLFHDSGLNLLMAIPSTVSIPKQLEFVHQCNHLRSKRSLFWMTQDWQSKFFRYTKVDAMDEPAGWFRVFDDNDNPDDYFFGAAGVLDNQGKLVIPNRFEDIEWVDGYFVGESNTGKELLNSAGKSLLLAENFQHVGNGLYFVWEKDSLQGVFDLNNKTWIVPLAKQNIRQLDDSVFFTFSKVIESTPTRSHSSGFGLMDQQGKVLLENKYSHFWFNAELNVIVAQVQVISGSRASYRYGIFDIEGEQLVPVEYDHVLNKQETVIHLRKDGHWYTFPGTVTN